MQTDPSLISSLLFVLPSWFIYVHPCMPVILLVPSYSAIFSLLPFVCTSFVARILSLQPLKFGTLNLSVLAPVLIPSVVASRSTIAGRPSKHSTLFFLAPHIRFLLTIVFVCKLYLLTYDCVAILLLSLTEC